MKVICFYLPQFHEIPENNEWWGQGFTEWTNVKKMKPLFDGHYQPRVPYNKNYYNLLDVETLRWQADIANEFGIYGFCFYHYWFDGHLLLEKPMELLLQNPSINIKYCISWANENWTNGWVDSSNKILISQNYGGAEQWIEHFNYFLKFFKDDRYIKIDNKPLLVIYRPEIIPCLGKMLDTWQELARSNGFDGIALSYQHVNYSKISDKNKTKFDYQIEYQPMYAHSALSGLDKKARIITIKQYIKRFYFNAFHKTLTSKRKNKVNSPLIYHYDEVWNHILNSKPSSVNAIAGAYVDWDNTIRKGVNGSLTTGVSAEKFFDFFKRQIIHVREEYNMDYIFVFAWNEWGESGYLEPDEERGFGMLEAIKRALSETGEFPLD